MIDTKNGEFNNDRIILSNTNERRATEICDELGGSLRISGNGEFALITLPDGTTVEDVALRKDLRCYLSDFSLDVNVEISDLLNDEYETLVTERQPSAPEYTVNDDGYEYQSYINYINVGNSWNYSKGAGTTVAIIDTGIDTDNEEFSGRISEYSYNATEDKIVKDYVLPSGEYDWSLVEDEQGHGTSVAGVLSAAIDGNGTVGIAPQVDIIVIKAECDESGTFNSLADLIFGLYYAIERDVAVVNMSFGVYLPNNPFEAPDKLAYDSDIMLVAAAGNDQTSSLCWPAADETVFGVGALAQDSYALAEYSNYGDNVDLVAPGTVYTTQTGGGFKTRDGTSFSAPIVSGAIALYCTYNKYQRFTSVSETLFASTYDCGELGEDWYYGFGALDINAFLCEEKGTVTFIMLTDAIDDTEKLFVREHTLQNLPEPERDYVVFDGWYYDIECTEELDYFVDTFSKDLILYAKWANEDDGLPYTYRILSDNTVEITGYSGKRRFITIPEKIEDREVSSIGAYAFSGNNRLRSVVLPETLKQISEKAFYACSNLVKIEIPDNVTYIGEYAFASCNRLSYVAFGNNSKLQIIDEFAFSSCGNISAFDIPSLVSAVEGSAFYGDMSLSRINAAVGNQNFASQNGVLYNKAGTKLVAYPAGKSGEYSFLDSVRTVGQYACAHARFKTVDLTDVVSIENNAFEGSSLEALTVADSVTGMGEKAFSGNYRLKSLTLGNGLTYLPTYAFSACNELSSVIIPDCITKIGDYTFSGCLSLDALVISENSSLQTIGKAAFSGCNIKRCFYRSR